MNKTYIRKLTMIMKYILLIFIAAYLNSVYAEEMVVKKITLARFETKDKTIVNLPKSSPYWPQIDRHTLTVDDEGNIYILNLWNNEILVYDGAGKLKRKIELKVKLNRFEYRNGSLEVTGDGKCFWVDGYNKSGILMQYILDENGSLVRHLPENDIWPSPDMRLCNKKNLVLRGGYIYDQQFNILNEKFTGFSDAEGKYSSYKGLLTKTSSSGKKLWGKQFYGNFAIIGIDANNYVYIEGGLRRGDPNSLYKLSSKREIIARASVPNPVPFLTNKEKDEWEMHSSEEFLSFFKVACNGDVYLIYQLTELPSLTFKRWLRGGEYFIYKFEMAGK